MDAGLKVVTPGTLDRNSSGTAHFFPLFQNENADSFKLRIPLDKTSDWMKCLHPNAESAFCLVDCNENECHEFLSLVLEKYKQIGLERDENGNFKRDEYGKIKRQNKNVFFFFCTLDSACLHLSSRLASWGCVMRLGYGSSMASFQDANDLVACLTDVQLRAVYHHYLLPMFEEPVIRLLGDAFLVHFGNQIDEDEETTTKILLILDFVLQDPEKLGGIVASKNSTEGTADKSFQLQVVSTKNMGDLSPISLLAMKVPTLEILASNIKSNETMPDEILEGLKDRPNSSLPLIVHLDYRRNTFWVTDEVLDIFNEKKLVEMHVNFDNQDGRLVHLLDRSLTTISKSIYLRSVVLRISDLARDSEYVWSELFRFLGGIFSIISRLVHPLDLRNLTMYPDSTSYRPRLGQGQIIDAAGLRRKARLQEQITQLSRAMDVLYDKNLHIISAFVSTKFIDSRRQSPVKILPVDIFRKLKEFLMRSGY